MPNLSNVILSNGLKIVQNVIQMTVKWLFFQEIAKIAQWLGALPSDPRE